MTTLNCHHFQIVAFLSLNSLYLTKQTSLKKKMELKKSPTELKLHFGIDFLLKGNNLS